MYQPGRHQWLGTEVLMCKHSPLYNLVTVDSGKMIEIALFYSAELYRYGLVFLKCLPDKKTGKKKKKHLNDFQVEKTQFTQDVLCITLSHEVCIIKTLSY